MSSARDRVTLTPLADVPQPPPCPSVIHRLHERLVHGLAILPDGQTIVTAGEDGALLHARIDDGAVFGGFYGHEGPVNSLALTPDGRVLVTGGDDFDVRVWDVEAREYRHV